MRGHTLIKKRNTIQKQLISEAANALRHPTAEEIFAEIQQRGFSLSLPTVYRNLKIMVEEGEVERISISGQGDRYDARAENHYHFKCNVCGKIIDLPADLYDEALDKKCENSLSVKIDKHNIQFTGICKKCNK